jgi:two-component system OmpR family sensor kinase
VYAVDADGREILERSVPKAEDRDARAPPEQAGLPMSRRVVLVDGRAYVLSVDGRRPGASFGQGGPGARGGPGPLLFPLAPIVGGMLASLAVAALLAWYVAKPIRSLRQAFHAAGQGNLDVRIGDGMGRRRDELADLGRDFDRTAAQLKLLMDGQRRLLHDVSHELRSPLARLQAAVGLARQQSSNVETSMDRIERESMRMDKLLDELLALSRAEAGLGVGHEENVDLVELVHDVVRDAMFEADARSSSVAFDTDVTALGATTIMGNHEMLHRALENVVRNAALHTPSGTRVQVAGTHDAARREVRFTVADEGPGVAATELGSIFEPFYRGSQARETPGHGLGLAIARRVVEAHGGSIRASNRATGGLAVEIRLPA